MLYKQQQGSVLNFKDGIAAISGLNLVQSGELINTKKSMGLVLNLLKNSIGAVFLTDFGIKIKDSVFRTFQLISINVSIFVLGKVLNTLGMNLSLFVYKNKDLLVQQDPITRLIEIKAPGIISRQSVGESLITGLKVLDSVVPIGLGQRELIIGDRQTGKTALAVDALVLFRNLKITI